MTHFFTAGLGGLLAGCAAPSRVHIASDLRDRIEAADNAEAVAVADVTPKQRAARTLVEAPAPDNVLAVKAAEALRAVCGFEGESLPEPQERPVRPPWPRTCALAPPHVWSLAA